MTGSAGARPDMNRGDPKFYTAKRTLISRFKLYLFAPREVINNMSITLLLLFTKVEYLRRYE